VSYESELVHSGAYEQAARVQSGDVSARELVAETLKRIDEVNPRSNAFRAVCHDAAMAQAAEVDERAAGEPLPMRGLPVGIKDNIDVEGELTTYGVDGQRHVAAAGLCGVALGSDGLGSIRVPSAFNGCSA
jgi:amidase